MEIIINVFIAILNFAAILVIYKSLSHIEMKNRILLIIIGEMLMYIILFIIYGISSTDIDETIVNSSRQIMIFTFLPINVIGIELPLLLTLKKLQQKDIKEEIFKKRMLFSLIISIIILIIEFCYIKDLQRGMNEFIDLNSINRTN